MCKKTSPEEHLSDYERLLAASYHDSHTIDQAQSQKKDDQ